MSTKDAKNAKDHEEKRKMGPKPQISQISQIENLRNLRHRWFCSFYIFLREPSRSLGALCRKAVGWSIRNPPIPVAIQIIVRYMFGFVKWMIFGVYLQIYAGLAMIQAMAQATLIAGMDRFAVARAIQNDAEGDQNDHPRLTYWSPLGS